MKRGRRIASVLWFIVVVIAASVYGEAILRTRHLSGDEIPVTLKWEQIVSFNSSGITMTSADTGPYELVINESFYRHASYTEPPLGLSGPYYTISEDNLSGRVRLAEGSHVKFLFTKDTSFSLEVYYSIKGHSERLQDITIWGVIVYIAGLCIGWLFAVDVGLIDSEKEEKEDKENI